MSLNNKVFSISISLLIFLFQTTHCEHYSDKVFNKNIRTVILEIDKEELSLPVIGLYGQQPLKLSFDELTNSIRTYYYTIVHCNSEWQQSALPQSDYLTGFFTDEIRNYTHSVNTAFDYIHYEIVFPNEEMQITMAGNYAIIVAEDREMENIILTKRFFVIENKIAVKAEIQRPFLQKNMDTQQSLKLTVDLGSYDVRNIYSELRIVAYKNFNLFEPAFINKPVFVSGRKIQYDDNDNILFYGNSEFRNIDVANLDLPSLNVKSISNEGPYTKIIMDPDKLISFSPYLYNKDINGRMLIKNIRGFDNGTEADYFYICLTAQSNLPHDSGNIFIRGAFSQWDLHNQFKMNYNNKSGLYEAKVLLKQGYYNYEYVYVPGRVNTPVPGIIEGSSYETENEYQIFVYHYDMVKGTETIIGYSEINSLIKK